MEPTIIEDEKIQKPGLPKAYVEEAFKLNMGYIANVFKPVERPQYSEPVYEGGELKLHKQGVVLDLIYDYLPFDGELVFQYWLPKISHLQRIWFDTVETKFGQRPYFLCNGCGKRCNCLYLRLDSPYWGCRDCQSLVYQVKKYNKRSATGFLGYSLNRNMALKDKETKIKRIDYAGRLTRKAASLMSLIKKWSPWYRWKTSAVPMKV